MQPTDDEQVRRALVQSGYLKPRRLPDGRWIAVQRMLYTTGLFVMFDDPISGWKTRYCYELYSQAARDATVWTGEGDPPGPWIKQKPEDRLNPAWLEKQ